MCGFVGFIDKQKKQDKTKQIKKMMDTIIHRGPDSEGSYIDSTVALGFRRLSIIDLKNGSQPIYNEDKTVVVVFNGEIYNFQEIKSDLIKKGHVFSTNTDTEVLVHGYEEYKEKILDYIRGMYAFAIWDVKNEELFIARDMFGVKPLYYGKTNNTFFFGSEIKSFLPHPNFKKELNKEALKPYLVFQYSPQEETFFKGIKKLMPGYYLKYKNGVLKTKRYHTFDFKSTNKDLNHYVDAIDDVVKESVLAHQISDVPVGAFLSGGVDSSYITSLQRPDKTYSVGFNDDKFNESIQAKELSKILNIENVTKIINPEECFKAFPNIQYHMDEPASNPSAVPLYFLAKLASKDVKVVLSGEGSDELFGGYDWYRKTPALASYNKLPKFIRKPIGTLAKFLPDFKGKGILVKGSQSIEDYFIGQAQIFDEKEALSILTDDYQKSLSVKEITKPIYDEVKDLDDVTKMQYLDLYLWMPSDICLKADKMSMASSLEIRVPFLDKKVLNVAYGIPEKFKVNEIDTKYALRLAANKNIPEEWAKRKKLGFPTPIRHWLKEEKYYNIVKEHFNSDYAKEFFNTDKINSILDDYYNGKNKFQRKIWTIFTFLVWYKEFFINR